MPEFPTITHVALTVSDLATSVPWYTQLFGAEAVLDEGGATAAEIQIPADAANGLRLITIGIDGTALTADCAVQIGDPGDRNGATPTG